MSKIETKIDQTIKFDDEMPTKNSCVELNEENSIIPISNSCDSKFSFKTLPERIPAFGLLLALCSVFFFSWQSVIVKVLTDLHSIEILVLRSVLQFIVYFIIALVEKHAIFGESGQRLYLAIRALTGTVSITTIYMAYRLMPIADASTIHFASPVFVAVFGYFLLKEKLTIVEIITGVITLIGVVVIAKPEFIFGSESEIVHENRLEGTILAIVASITGAFVQITLRKLKKTPVAVVCTWFAFSIVISGLIILVIIDELVWPTGWLTWILILANGVCCVGDQFFFTLAFKYENAGPVSVVRTFNIALVFIWEVSVLSESVEWTSIVGACLVFLSILIMTIFKWKCENPAQFNRVLNMLLFRKNSIETSIEKPSIETFSQNFE